MTNRSSISVVANTLFSAAIAASSLLCAANAADNAADHATFQLTSSDIQEGQAMAKRHEFQGFGCDGDNQSPQLSWQNAPAATKAFALVVYDADAPTGSGWWHWQVLNIPSDVTSLPRNAGAQNSTLLPKEALQVENDYGYAGFGGACPPPGHGVHHYRFTVYALKSPLSLPEHASGALAGYMINANALASATLTATYQRQP